MKNTVALLLTFALLGTTPHFAEGGTIVSKADTDRIFALSESQWEAQAQTMTHPDGWIVQVVETTGGISVVATDPRNGVELSTEPVYAEEDPSRPQMVIVSRQYPAGSIPSAASFETNLQAAASVDLGAGYDVGVKVARTTENDRVEIFIAKAQAEVVEPKVVEPKAVKPEALEPEAKDADRQQP